MGRPSNAELAARAERENSAIPAITYIPRDQGDPADTLWNRHRFRANVPVTVRDVVGGLTALEMVELAKNNPHFSVEGFEQAKGTPTVPETSEQYKSYAVGWIRLTNSSRELGSRWRQEEDLRVICGCGEDDVEYLQTIFKPRMALLKDQEALQQSAVNE